MKVLWLVLVLLLTTPGTAQDSASRLLVSHYDAENRVDRVYVLDADTGEIDLITELSIATANLNSAGWLPEGQFWTLDTVEEWEPRIRIFDAASLEQVELDESRSVTVCSLPFESPGEDIIYISQSSPTGRYTLLRKRYETGDEEYSYRDTQTGTVTPIDLDYPAVFVAWSEDETAILFNADFEVADNREFPRKVVAYQLASAEVETVLETDQWIDNIYPNGEWLIVSARSPTTGDDAPSIGTLYVQHGSESMAYQFQSLNFEFWVTPPGATWSPDGRWFTYTAADGVYRFDSTTNHFDRLRPAGDEASRPLGLADRRDLAFMDGEQLNLWDVASDSITGVPQAMSYTAGVPANTDKGGRPFWSPDSRYLAFMDGEQLNLWDVENDSVTVVPQAMSHIVGWQSGGPQVNLLRPCSYGDGNV